MNASRKLIELSTDCRIMTSDDLRFEEFQISNKPRANPFLRESLQIRNSADRRLFRLGTDRALEEVTKTLEQVVPLRKLLANIQKKVHVLSSQIKEKNREPVEPKKVMSLPGLGIYIVPKPPTAAQSRQSGDTHKRTASYRTYCPIVVHARPSDTNQKEGSESTRKITIVDRGTQPSPPNEFASCSNYYPIADHPQSDGPESMRKSTIADRRTQVSPSKESNNDTEYGDAGNDNCIIAEEKNKLMSPPNESNISPEIPAVATQTALLARDLPLDSESASRHGQTMDSGLINCSEKPAVATQTSFPPSTVADSHRCQPEEWRLTKNDVDAIPISDLNIPYLPPYLQYSHNKAKNNYLHSGNTVNTGLFQNYVSWKPPSVNNSGENSLAVHHPQDWTVLNKNVGFTLNNNLPLYQEVYPTQNRYISMSEMPYFPGNEDRPNFLHEKNVFPLQEQVYPSIIDRERFINVVPPQNRHTLNMGISFSPRNDMSPSPQTREVLANCLPEVNGVVYSPYSGNDTGKCLLETQSAKLPPEQIIVPNHFPPLNSFASVQRPQDLYTLNQSINLNSPNNIHNSPSQTPNNVLDPEGDVTLSKFRNNIEVDSQQKQIVSAQNTRTRINSSGAQKTSRGGNVTQINYTKESGVHSPNVGGLVNAPRFGDSVDGDPFHLEVLPGAAPVTTCHRTPETVTSKEEVSPMCKMYLKLAEPWSRQRPVKQREDQAIGEMPSLLSDPADTF